MKHVFRNLILIATVLCCYQQAFAQQMSSPLPLDRAVRIGKLKNGLTYYIRKNSLPADRADFYIAQEVGSIQEDSTQRGLAHFLEHMCFNGTTHFPGDALKQYLERIGVKFGKNLNAYTSIDETVYNISNVPVTTPGAVDSCLLILHDWSNGLILDSVEIDKERGVINEEWRTRMSATERFQEKMLPAIFAGTKYATCFPIGTMDVVMNFKPQTLREYYEKWYRPDLQGIFIVGDIDVDVVESKITEIFSDIPSHPSAAERIYYPVHDNKEPIIFIAQDKEQPEIQVIVFNKHATTPDDQKNNIDYLTQQYIIELTCDILNDRLEELVQTARSPFVYAETYDDDFFVAKTKDAFTAVMVCKEDAIDTGIVALLRELERARQFGFTHTEYDRARAKYLRELESNFNERDKRKNEEYINEYVRHFLDKEPIPGIENKYAIISRMAPEITIEVVNEMMKSLITDSNQVVAVFGPEKEKFKMPTENDIKDILKEVKAEKLSAYVDKTSSEPLMSRLPKDGKIISENKNERFGTTELKLANGVKVIIKKTNFKTDEILMKGLSLGGSSLFPDSEIINIKGLEAVAIGGLGNFSAINIEKVLVGKKAIARYEIDDKTETVSGSCSSKDFETMMQLTYLTFTAPRKDEVAFTSYKDRLRSALLNQEMDPKVAFSDSINQALRMGHPRSIRLKADMIDLMDYDKILDMYNDRYKDASDFTFIFVGNLNVKKLKPYIARYLGALPAINREETFKDNKMKYRKGAYRNEFIRQQETVKASNFICFTGTCKYDLKNEILMDMTTQILDLVYTGKVREDEGGTYGVYVGGNLSKYPKEVVGLQILFDTAPAKRDKLMKTIFTEIDNLVKAGPSETNLKKVKEYMLKKHTEDLKENDYWIETVGEHLFTGMDRNGDYEKLVKSFTVKDIQDFASDLFKQKNEIEVSMISPENK